MIDKGKIPSSKIKSRVLKLRKSIDYHRKKYHLEDTQEISDEALDALKHELAKLEEQYPSLITKNSPTQKVEGGVKKGFKKVKHKIRQWSFNDAFNEEEIEAFLKRVDKNIPNGKREYFCEEKIDGFKAILTYKNGELITAATRGDGVIGEDVTDNMKTITDLPKKLNNNLDITVEGEVFMSKKEFERINKERAKKEESVYANPRNLAAGSIRHLNSEICKSRKLSFLAYDIAEVTKFPETQEEEYKLLDELGFKTNPNVKLTTTKEEIIKYWDKRYKEQDKLPYCTDGIVIKLNNREEQLRLGFTGKAPRFAIALKFPAEERTSQIMEITFQIGRTGVITPVANLTPVSIAGSVVQRATLHNEDQIKKLDVRLGDTVVVRKAGDIIPEVVSVLYDLRPKNTKPFNFPKYIEGCGGDGSIVRQEGESAYRCVDRNSFSQHILRMQYFVSKKAFDIDGLGKKIIEAFAENNLIAEYADIFDLTRDEILALPGFKEKSADNIINSVNQRREVVLSRLLIALSIDGVGEEVAILLSRRFQTLDKLKKADLSQIKSIAGVGDKLAESIDGWFRTKEKNDVLNRLLKHIVVNPDSFNDSVLNNKNIAITGTFPIAREEIKRILRQNGASITSSISKQTDILFVGENPGSKYEKAKELNIKILKDADIMLLLKQ